MNVEVMRTEVIQQRLEVGLENVLGCLVNAWLVGEAHVLQILKDLHAVAASGFPSGHVTWKDKKKTLNVNLRGIIQYLRFSTF